MAGGALEVGFLVSCAGAVCMGSLSCPGGSLISSPMGVAAPGAFFVTSSRGPCVPYVFVAISIPQVSYKGGA